MAIRVTYQKAHRVHVTNSDDGSPQPYNQSFRSSERTAQRPSAGNPGALPLGPPVQPAAIMAMAHKKLPFPGR